MGTKRQHQETKSNRELPADTSKRVKSNHHGSETDDSTVEAKVPASGSSLIRQLKDLLKQTVSHPQLFQNHPAGAEIVNMATQLHASLSKTEKKMNVKIQPPSDSSLPPPPRIHNASLERAVFQHPSSRLKNISEGQEINYDRLEVLGDAYVELFSTRLIWDQFPGMPAGRISQIREGLVKNETIAELASSYGFDGRIQVPDHHRTNPKSWMKVRGDVFEAYVAAAILSDPVDGLDVVEKWLRQLWLPRLSQIRPEKSVLTHKEQLAKKILSKGIVLQYNEEKPMEQLEGGKQMFYIGAYLTGYGWQKQHLGSGTGLSKSSAGDQAAQQALHNSPLIDRVAAAKAAYDRQAKRH